MARGPVARRARKRIAARAHWFVGALCLACGADAGAGSDEGSSTLSLGSQGSLGTPPAVDARGTPASTPSDTSDPAGSGAADAPENGAALALPSPRAIGTPPSEEPAPLPSAELDTPISLDRLAPAEVVIEPGDCRFEFLGESVRCENTGGPNLQETDAPDLVACMRLCLEREDCSAVTDYLWLGEADLGCFLYLSTCDEPALTTLWGEEDQGRDFRRSCSMPSTN